MLSHPTPFEVSGAIISSRTDSTIYYSVLSPLAIISPNFLTASSDVKQSQIPSQA